MSEKKSIHCICPDPDLTETIETDPDDEINTGDIMRPVFENMLFGTVND